MAQTQTGMNKKEKVIKNPNAPQQIIIQGPSGPIETPQPVKPLEDKPKVDTPKTNSSPTNPEVFTDPYGNLSGVDMPDGRTFLGLSPQQVRKIMEADAAKKRLPANAQVVGTQAKQDREQEQQVQTAQEAISGIGMVQEPTSSNVPISSSLKGALPDTIASALVGAGTGAASGLIAGAPGSPVASIALGVAGGVIGAVKGIISNLKAEERQTTAATYKDFTTSKQNIKAIITYAKNGGDPVEARNLYNAELAKIYQAERDLKALSEREWLSKARPELTAIEAFRRNQITYDMLLTAAIMKNPDTNFEFPQEELISV